MSSDQTADAVARQPGFLAEAILGRLLSRIGAGSLTVVLPSGTQLDHTGGCPGPRSSIVIHHWRALRKLLTQGGVGFAESYIAGDWSSPDLPAFLELAARNLSSLEAKLGGNVFVGMAARIRHWARANSRAGSRKNIAFHYDLGNDFYRCWLDRNMTYSSALYSQPSESLEDAQARKIARIAELLGAGVDDDILEIGCGWGALAIALAPNCRRIEGVTLSAEQLAHAKFKVAEAGLGDKVSLALRDYRDVQGQFDRIVSIEMIEAVGEAYWPVYFRTLHDRLRAGGVVLLQAITIDERHFDAYRRWPDFIQQYVFPGGMLPTASALAREARSAGLEPSTTEFFGQSYALTLAEWRRRFFAAHRAIGEIGFSNEFRRLWDYYLSYCEAGFRSGVIDVGFFAFQRPA